ncbi:hypothetical protein GCM10027517_12770 [Phycicoccus ginsengisoli]
MTGPPGVTDLTGPTGVTGGTGLTAGPGPVSGAAAAARPGQPETQGPVSTGVLAEAAASRTGRASSMVRA